MKFTTDVQTLVLAVSAVIPAAAKDRYRPHLCGVHLDVTSDTLVVVATNGYMLACYDKVPYDKLNVDTSSAVMITTKSAKAFVKEFEGLYGYVTISVNSTCTAECGDKIMSLDMINDVYPDWRKVVPAESESGEVSKICFGAAVLKNLVQCFEKFSKNDAGTQSIVLRHTGEGLAPVVCTLGSPDHQEFFVVIAPCRI